MDKNLNELQFTMTANISGTSNKITICANFGQTSSEQEIAQTANNTFAIEGVMCSADSFVVTESSVLRTNICAEKPAHRKSAKRYQPLI